jgi:hypothetical protein
MINLLFCFYKDNKTTKVAIIGNINFLFRTEFNKPFLRTFIEDTIINNNSLINKVGKERTKTPKYKLYYSTFQVDTKITSIFELSKKINKIEIEIEHNFNVRIIDKFQINHQIRRIFKRPPIKTDQTMVSDVINLTQEEYLSDNDDRQEDSKELDKLIKTEEGITKDNMMFDKKYVNETHTSGNKHKGSSIDNQCVPPENENNTKEILPIILKDIDHSMISEQNDVHIQEPKPPTHEVKYKFENVVVEFLDMNQIILNIRSTINEIMAKLSYSFKYYIKYDFLNPIIFIRSNDHRVNEVRSMFNRNNGCTFKLK